MTSVRCPQSRMGSQCELPDLHDDWHYVTGRDEALRWRTEATQADLARGHEFTFRATSRGSYTVAGDPRRHEAPDDGGIGLEVSVRAFDLPAALRAAAEVPLKLWRDSDE